MNSSIIIVQAYLSQLVQYNSIIYLRCGPGGIDAVSLKNRIEFFCKFLRIFYINFFNKLTNKKIIYFTKKNFEIVENPK